MKYEKQVALLIDLIPSIAAETDFALKGGTAIKEMVSYYTFQELLYTNKSCCLV